MYITHKRICINNGKILRNLSKLVYLVLDPELDMQAMYGIVGSKKMGTISNGMWQSSMCVNAKTSVLHTEEDYTYTFCKAPSQISNDIKDRDYQRIFFIQVSETEIIAIPFAINLLFLLTVTFLTHRQHCNLEFGIDGRKFYNIVSYGNTNLHAHQEVIWKKCRQYQIKY